MIACFQVLLSNSTCTATPGYLHVLPLYAMLPPHLQKRVFDPPPPGRGLHLSTIRLNVGTFCGMRWVHNFPPVY